MVFHWSLNDSKSPQDSRTLFRIQADICNAVVWMVSTPPHPQISSSSCLLMKRLGNVPSAPIRIGITVTLIFVGFFFSSLAKSFLLSSDFRMIHRDSKVHYTLFFGGVIITRSGLLVGITGSVWILIPQWILCVSLFVLISFDSMVQFQFLAQFPVDPLSNSLISFLWCSFQSFLHHRYPMVFPRKSSQVSRTFHSILADLCNAVGGILFTCPLIFKSSNLCTNPLGIVLSAPITSGITVTFMFHSIFCFLAMSRYPSQF